MSLLTSTSSIILWRDVVKKAESQCAIQLKEELEAYLVSLLVRYTNKPEVVKQVLATAFLEALNLQEHHRALSLQYVGDQCLLFAGLFPKAAARKNVNINYFVNLGRSAYSSISEQTDLFGSLALKFVVLMDILQSICPSQMLLPLEAYEQWEELGSKRALKALQQYTSCIPIKKIPKI